MLGWDARQGSRRRQASCLCAFVQLNLLEAIVTGKGLWFRLGVMSLVTSLCGVVAASASASALNICVPEKAGAAIVTPVKGACKAKYTATSLLPQPEQEKLQSILPYEKYQASGVAGKPTIEISGANLQIISGTGNEQTLNGAGNLVLGYNEDPGTQTGSDSLIISGLGFDEFTSWGDLVAGRGDKATNAEAVVFGVANSASGDDSAVLGGYGNTASGNSASVSGGGYGVSSGFADSITGGEYNNAGGASRALYASVDGGRDNEASGEGSTAGGGISARASGSYSSVSGGAGDVASGAASWAGGGVANTASGPEASASGGHENVAKGEFAMTSGGSHNQANGFSSTVDGGEDNAAWGNWSSVGAGFKNRTFGHFSVIFAGKELETLEAYEYLP
jgi:hypothetical protein